LLSHRRAKLLDKLFGEALVKAKLLLGQFVEHIATNRSIQALVCILAILAPARGLHYREMTLKLHRGTFGAAQTLDNLKLKPHLPYVAYL
jgi:hypothetical protein